MIPGYKNITEIYKGKQVIYRGQRESDSRKVVVKTPANVQVFCVVHRQESEGDFEFEFGVFGEIDFTHPAFTDLFNYR